MKQSSILDSEGVSVQRDLHVDLLGSGGISIDVQVNQSTGPSPVRKACVTRVAMCSRSETYEEPSKIQRQAPRASEGHTKAEGRQHGGLNKNVLAHS
jgi:hypothetical protein